MALTRRAALSLAGSCACTLRQLPRGFAPFRIFANLAAPTYAAHSAVRLRRRRRASISRSIRQQHRARQHQYGRVFARQRGALKTLAQINNVDGRRGEWTYCCRFAAMTGDVNSMAADDGNRDVSRTTGRRSVAEGDNESRKAKRKGRRKTIPGRGINWRGGVIGRKTYIGISHRQLPEGRNL